MQQSMGLQRIRHNWVTELNWTHIYHNLWQYNPNSVFEMQRSLVNFFPILVAPLPFYFFKFKELTCQCKRPKRPSSIPGSGRSPGAGNGNPFQHSCLENSIDREAWQATIHGVAKSQESDMTEQLSTTSWFTIFY